MFYRYIQFSDILHQRIEHGGLNKLNRIFNLLNRVLPDFLVPTLIAKILITAIKFRKKLPFLFRLWRGSIYPSAH